MIWVMRRAYPASTDGSNHRLEVVGEAVAIVL